MKSQILLLAIAGCLLAGNLPDSASAGPGHHHGPRFEEELRESAGYSIDSAREYAYCLGKQVASGIISRKEGEKRLFRCVSDLSRNGVTSYPNVIQRDYQQGIDDVTYRRIPKMRKPEPHHDYGRHDGRR